MMMILMKMTLKLIHVKRMSWCNRCKQRTACKKKIDKELMPITSHPTIL